MSRIADFYPLTPLQQGLLFHLLDAPASGQYHEQLTCQLTGELDTGALIRAWRQVIERHPVLRTAFVWRGVKEPVQAVHTRVRLPLRVQDWQRLPAATRERLLERWLDTEHRRGFDPARPPLLRLLLARLGPQDHLLVWSYSHLVLDGWSVPLVLQDVMAHYRALRHGSEVSAPPPRPYRHYVAWLRRQDRAAAEAFWRRSLAGFRTPTELGLEERDADPGDIGELEEVLPPARLAELQALARRRGLTLNTLCCAAWALLLARYSGRREVLFGLTLAGRPPQIPGVEAMVGLFINTLPVRVAVPPEQTLGEWLGQLQVQLGELQGFQHTPLAAVQGWSEVPRGQPLFDSLLVFENYPASPTAAFELDGLAVRPLRFTEHTHYPLTFSVVPGAGLSLELAWQRRRCPDTGGRRRLRQLTQVLLALTGLDAAEPRLAELSLLSPAERHQLLREWSTTPALADASQPVLARIGRQAAARPDAVALLVEDPAARTTASSCASRSSAYGSTRRASSTSTARRSRT